MAREKIPTIQTERIKQIDHLKPTLFLSEKDLPEIKSWKTGKEYDLILHVKQTNSSEDIKHPETGKNMKKPLVTARFEVLSAEAPAGTQYLNENDYTDQKLKRLQEKSQEY